MDTIQTAIVNLLALNYLIKETKRYSYWPRGTVKKINKTLNIPLTEKFYPVTSVTFYTIIQVLDDQLLISESQVVASKNRG